MQYPLKNSSTVALVVAFEEFDQAAGEWMPCAEKTIEIIEPGQTANLTIECLKRRFILGAMPDA